MILITICCFFTFIFAQDDVEIIQHPTSDILEAAGFPHEDHPVVTADGFVLGVTRIPALKAGAPAVILQHGLLDSGATWVLNLPEQSLGFILHRQGWDVWLGNSRGNTYSSNHSKLGPDDLEYWNAIDFSAMAQFDLPALVDYILQHTGRKSIAYIGHSQGTTQMFAALANNHGQLRQKISIFIALSPVAYVRNIKSIAVKQFAKLRMPEVLQMFGQRSFIPNEEIYSKLGVVCKYTPTACKLVPLVLCGADMANLNASRFSFYLEYTAAGTSTHNMCHWGQHVRNGRFGFYDWGILKNFNMYHRWSPPQYDLSQINIPVALFAGGADTLAEEKDIEVLAGRIHTVVYSNIQPAYGHMDFIWGLNAHERIYPSVLKLLQKYSPVGVRL